MRLLGIGDNVVDRYRQLGRMFPGGQALNVAVAARRAGAVAGYLGALGTDVAGRLVLDALRTEGLDVERLRIVEGPNAYAEVQLVDGNRVFVGSSTGVSRFSLTREDLAYASSFDVAHSSESSFLEAQIPALAGHVPVCFDFSTRRDPAYLEALLPHLAVACFSASNLDEEETDALLRHALARGPQIAFATRGEADVLLRDRDGLWRQPVTRVEALDTLGAGDAFTGRFLVGAFSGEPRGVSLLAAAEVAARTCETYGAFGHGGPIESEEEDQLEVMRAGVSQLEVGVAEGPSRGERQSLERE